ncbi:MAG: hypothetical protein D6732_14310 [Methanobacteriota archaeon]|nr:MAG: hypothetical protein D6732_14310 [Euryarchaeota archaeon]
MTDEFIPVDDLQVLTLAHNEELLEQRTLPFLRFLLRNGSDFIMSMIPLEIAIAISAYQNGQEIQDSRLRIHDLVGQLALVEKVEIDSVVPGTGVYQATIWLQPEGFSQSISFSMIPSHATLLAVLNDAPIYISRALWEEYIAQKEEARHDIDFDLKD